MGQKLPSLPRPAPYLRPPINPNDCIRRKCAERFCNAEVVRRGNEYFPYCCFDCKDWDRQVKEVNK